MLVAIVKKRLKLTTSLYEILQMWSLAMFERPPDQLLSKTMRDEDRRDATNELHLSTKVRTLLMLSDLWKAWPSKRQQVQSQCADTRRAGREGPTFPAPHHT